MEDKEEDPNTRGQRERTMTEKGFTYHLERRFNFRKRADKELSNLSRNIKELLLQNPDRKTVKHEHARWLQIYEELLIAHDEYQNLIPTSTEKVSDDETFHRRNREHISLKEKVEDWILKHSTPIDNRSMRSKTTSRTSSSHIAKEKIKEHQRKAELVARATALTQKRELEQAKLKLKLMEEELEIKTEIEISDAKAKALEELEDRELIDLGLEDRDEYLYEHSHIKSQEAKDTMTLNPCATPWEDRRSYNQTYAFHSRTPDPSPRYDTRDDHEAHISAPPRFDESYSAYCHPQIPPLSATSQTQVQNYDILSVARELNKPKAEIQNFEGNPMDYQRFMRQFNTKVCANTSSYEERLNFLLQFTSGEANRIVTGYSHLNAEGGYNAALNEFEDRYGDPDVVAQAYVKKALGWHTIKPDNSKALDEYAIFLMECQHAVNSIDSAKVLEYSENMKLLIKKLPFYLQEKWRNIVYDLKDKRETVRFQNVVNFVRKEAKKANDPIYGRDVMNTSSDSKQGRNEKSTTVAKPKKNFATNATESTSPSSDYSSVERMKSKTVAVAYAKPCIYCEGKSHSLQECKNIMKLPLKERYALLKSKGLCFSCLKSGHHKGVCQNKITCIHCKRYHPSILHLEPRQNSDKPMNSSSESDHNSNSVATPSVAVSSSAAHMGAGDSIKQALPIIPVRLKSKSSDKFVNTYAFLDSGSTATFCKEEIINSLHLEGKRTTLTLTTMGECRRENCFVISDLELSDLNGENTINLPPIYTQPNLPVSKRDIVTNEDIQQWPHLNNIHVDEIDSDIGLLIGVNVPKAMEPWEVITSVNKGPFAVKTLFGWVINGPLDSRLENDTYNSLVNVTVNRIDVKLEEQMRYQFNHDFSEKVIDDVPEPSKEDKRFLQFVTNSVCFENGHYTVGLPFKSENVTMPNNRKQAEQRLTSLSRKLENDSEFHDSYKDFMDKIIAEGYAQKVPTEKLLQDDGRVWYLPHHGVFHPKKRKLRVVFDCAAKFKGTSLNEQLLQGPNLTNTLIGTLTRFREEETAIMGDIDSMFYQVRIPSRDSSFLRFLWWNDGNTSSSIIEYQMVVHLFGATSSPSCANFCLRKTAQDWTGQFSDETIKTVMRNFYVDDCLKSVKSVENAVFLVKDLRTLLGSGGFHIAKWTSNSREVMTSIPISERAKEVKDLDLDYDNLPIDRALGVQWCQNSDSFQFKLELKNQPLTRRGILSMVSSVYDPLGFLAPFVLKAKIILQELCKLQLGWDDEIPDYLAIQWKQWYHDLKNLEDFKVSRCFKPCDFHPVSMQLHHFADASETGYGTVSYLRLENAYKETHCSFVMGKSRVAPLKQRTIPRLELTAATVAVKTNKLLLNELDFPVDRVVYWTDSMAVLRYIQNTSARFHTFVANRLTVIHEGSRTEDWRYINTKLNPADYASRGISTNDLIKHENWIKTPNFLSKPEDQWPKSPSQTHENLMDCDPEVKKNVKIAVTKLLDSENTSTDSVKMLIQHYSSWHSLKKAVAWILKVRKELLNRARVKRIGTCSSLLDGNHDKPMISHQDMKDAEQVILVFIQQQEFSTEMSTPASRNSHVKRSSSIKSLDPFLQDGLLRVGGRLHRSSMPAETKHPIILPKDHHVSTLILRQIHVELMHSGRNHMLARLREHYWLIHAQSAIRKVISKCVICRRQRSKVGQQKMASLPTDRIIPDEPPFSRVGVDYFGPFEVKLRRSHVKRYGVIFTCLTSRAVHLEVANSLDTDSYINALRRFIARRGQVKKIRSDNGTNFVGAERELKQSLQQWNLSQIQSAMLQKNIDWQFNPPAGSHHGGVWERIIRTIRKAMNSVLKEQTLDDEGLHTLMCEIEYTINDRPITKNTDHHSDLEPLTPNHLLLMKRKPNLPPGVFNKTDVYHRRRWRQVQYMANLFWHRWVREYLPLLQERQKWHDTKRNLQVGDIVVIVDSSAPRNSWPMGVVCETIPDSNGLVRQVKVKTATNTLIRPIDKLCLILEMDQEH